jgi:hypothetical protein
MSTPEIRPCRRVCGRAPEGAFWPAIAEQPSVEPTIDAERNTAEMAGRTSEYRIYTYTAAEAGLLVKQLPRRDS